LSIQTHGSGSVIVATNNIIANNSIATIVGILLLFFSYQLNMDDITMQLIKTLENGGAIVDKSKYTINNIRMSYNKCLRMLLDVGAQIERLKELGYGLLYLTPSDIVETVDGSFLIIINDNLLHCDEGGNMLINITYSFNDSMAPELKDISTLPSTVYYTTSYFSLLSIACSAMDIINIQAIYQTKMYYLLDRCSTIIPVDRIFLYV
jgi:hypothetical protein